MNQALDTHLSDVGYLLLMCIRAFPTRLGVMWEEQNLEGRGSVTSKKDNIMHRVGHDKRYQRQG